MTALVNGVYVTFVKSLASMIDSCLRISSGELELVASFELRNYQIPADLPHSKLVEIPLSSQEKYSENCFG